MRFLLRKLYICTSKQITVLALLIMKNLALFTTICLLLACQQKAEQHGATERGKVIESSVATPQLYNKTAPKMNTDWINQAYLMGKFQPNTNADFTLVPAAVTDGAQQYYLRAEALAAFQAMRTEALKSAITLKIISATRPFDRQKQIWEAKWNGSTAVGGQNLAKIIADPTQRARKILTYSSMPGTSRHHWGTDVDLNSLEPAYFKRGQGKQIYDWLNLHAAEFGFCQPYSAGRTNGYNEEQWHWSYMPIAQLLTQKYPQLVTNQDISGFQGSQTAVDIDMVNQYVLGINQNCK